MWRTGKPAGVMEGYGSAKLEQYLLDTGILSDRELSLAKKVQQREQGPLLMVLLRLNLIDIKQLSYLWDFELPLWA